MFLEKKILNKADFHLIYRVCTRLSPNRGTVFILSKASDVSNLNGSVADLIVSPIEFEILDSCSEIGLNVSAKSKSLLFVIVFAQFVTQLALGSVISADLLQSPVSSDCAINLPLIGCPVSSRYTLN